VVLTGATGRTGVLVYNLLKTRGVPVRAFVRNATKAKERLGCTKCDESEGIFVGDVTKPETMEGVMKGAGALVILTSAAPVCNPFPNCNYTKGAYPVDIDFKGSQNQVAALIKGAGGIKPVILISSEGTTKPDGPLDMMGNGHIDFFKLNAEAFLMSSGVPFTIVAPCGLGNDPGTATTLYVAHDDGAPGTVPRADVARVVVAAAQSPQKAKNLRFDLCSTDGKPTMDTDIPALFKAARYPWQTSTEQLVV
jgi:nucleoside-diphosphate-sugar epimerase